MAEGDVGRQHWLLYYRKGGKLFSRWVSGYPPTKDPNYVKFRSGWMRKSSGGGSSGGSRTGGGRARSGSGGGSGGGSASGRGGSQRRRRPPYWKRERYFHAKRNKWMKRWRYTPTNAEILARREGMKKDNRGFYRWNNGRKVYKTGRQGDRRFHYEWRDGRRRRVWDDPARWPYEVRKKRQTLQKRKSAIKNKLDSLREQYASARGNQHTLRRNISRRIKQLEASLSRTNNALKRLPASKPFRIDVTKHEPKYKGGVLVQLDFAEEPSGKSPLSFSPKLRVGRNSKVFVRATIHLGDRDWRPGLLGAPDALRVKWSWPRQWIRMDRLPRATDEYMASNPLYITRVFRSPGTGRRTPKFECQVFTYEFLPDYDGQAATHPEERVADGEFIP